MTPQEPATELCELPFPWSLAFDEAWASYRSDNFGIGAVLVDPATDEIVSTGRNGVNERDPAPRTIGGNFLAHAEMNAFVAMDRFFARGLHLYTTLEPCLMCAATSIQLNVEYVHFAAVDEFFDDLDDLWTHNAYTATRRPARSGPLALPIARFARLLPLSFMLRQMPESNAATKARRDEPDLVRLAERLNSSDDLATVARDGFGHRGIRRPPFAHHVWGLTPDVMTARNRSGEGSAA